MRTPARSLGASCLNGNHTAKATEHANEDSSDMIMHKHVTLQGKERRRKRGGGAGVAPPGTMDALHWSDDMDLDINGGVWREASKAGDRAARLAEVFQCIRPPHTVRLESEIILHDITARVEDSSGGGAGDDGWGADDTDECATGAQVGTADDFVHMWEVRNPIRTASRRAVIVQRKTRKYPTIKVTINTLLLNDSRVT